MQLTIERLAIVTHGPVSRLTSSSIAGQLFDLGKQLEQKPPVIETYFVSGDFDYSVRVAVKDTREFEWLRSQSP